MKIINRRSIILIAALVLSLFVFVFTEARFTAYLVILFLLIIAGALCCVLFTGRRLKVAVDSQIQGTKGVPSRADIAVSSKSRIPVVMCTAHVTVENMLTGEKDREKYCFCVGRRKARRLRVLVKPDYCGCMRVSSDGLEISDPLRLFSRYVKTGDDMSEHACRIYYMPEAIETYVSPEAISTYNMESYKYSALTRGNDPSETFDIKNYEIGDSFKAIHWKLSSKHDDLVIREFGLPIENNVLVVLDKCRGRLTPAEADNETEFAASLSFTLLKKEINHTIGWYDLNGESFEMKRVDSMDSYWAAMKEVISSPFGEDKMSSVDRYIEAEGVKEFSAYILVSPEGRDIEKLMAYGQADIYRPEEFR